MPYSLTPAMADCARVIAELTALEGRPPSLEEIAAELDLCKSRTYRIVRSLVDRQWILRTRFQRGYRLVCAPPPLDLTPLEVTEAGRAHLEAAA